MKSRLLLRIISVVGLVFALGVHLTSNAIAEDAPCDTFQVNGGDQAFLMNLNTPLSFGGVVYTNNIYVTPKGTLTFGQGDFTFWDYPPTPSFSVASYDYHAFTSSHPWGTQNILYVKYGSTPTSICVEWRVLPWGQTYGTPVTIVLRAQVDPVTYEFTPTYQVSSNAPANARYGVRYVAGGAVQPISVQTITPMSSPTPIPAPVISPTPTPTPTPTETASPTPTPSETITPSPTPTQSSEPTIEPSIQPTETPTPTPTPSETLEISPSPTPSETQNVVQDVVPNPTPIPTLIVDPTPTPEVENEEIDLDEVFTPIFDEPKPEPEPVVTQDPIIEEDILETEQENMSLLDSTEIVLAVFGNAVEQTFEFASEVAGEVFALADESVGAFLNIGDDMSQEVREEAQTVVVSTIIVTQIASSVSIGTAMRSTGVRIK
jgi:hypothetical protein